MWLPTCSGDSYVRPPFNNNFKGFKEAVLGWLPLLLPCCSILAPSFSLFPSLLHSVIDSLICLLFNWSIHSCQQSTLNQRAQSLGNRPPLFSIPSTPFLFFNCGLLPFSFGILVPKCVNITSIDDNAFDKNDLIFYQFYIRQLFTAH